MEDVLELKASEMLKGYEGANNFILKLKYIQSISPKFMPNKTQSDYIVTHFNDKPKIARKWVLIDPYFAEKFSKDKNLDFIPERIWVEKILVERDKSFHIWGKLKEENQLSDFWFPKAFLLKDNFVQGVSVDFDKYAHRKPLEHQKTAIIKLLENKKYILADDQGLGKTTATIIAAIESGAKKTLIVCPASLKINWMREFKMYTDKSIYICESDKFESGHDIYIINYDILSNFHSIKLKGKAAQKNDYENDVQKDHIRNEGFDLMILDEAHAAKNNQAIRSKLINDIGKKMERIWLLTGTPVTSRPIDYFNLLSLVESPVAKNWKAYAIRYCGGYQFNSGGRKIWNVRGATNLEELKDRTSKLVLRRLKSEVLDLPEKIITPIFLNLNSSEYNKMMEEYHEWQENSKKEKPTLSIKLSKLAAVRQLIANEKIRHTKELIDTTLDEDKKVIVFCNFTESLNAIYDSYKKIAVKLDGSMNKLSRQQSVDEFQNNDKIKVFVGNIKAAGVGLTLTSAETVIFNDLSFVPAEHAQAEDRAYRYGQKNTVVVYYPVFENTIEMTIYDILENKKKVISTIMGDSDILDDFFKSEFLK